MVQKSNHIVGCVDYSRKVTILMYRYFVFLSKGGHSYKNLF